MTRKHYRAIADAIKNVRHADYVDDEHRRIAFATKLEIANSIAIAMKADNAAFDRDKFMDACNL